jgi:hypothetical protein
VKAKQVIVPAGNYYRLWSRLDVIVYENTQYFETEYKENDKPKGLFERWQSLYENLA